MLRTGMCLVVLAVIVGCGGAAPAKPLPKTAPAVGLITLDGTPLPFATVMFAPRGATKGIECVGVTDETGKYTLTQTRGGEGVPPGEYTVVVSRYVRGDGTPIRLDPKEPPANQGAVESLPPQYSSSIDSVLVATVPETGGEFKFDLKSRQ